MLSWLALIYTQHERNTCTDQKLYGPSVHQFSQYKGKPAAAYRIVRNNLLNLIQLLLAQLDLKSCYILLQVFDALGPRNGEDIIPLVVHPGQSQLAQATPLLVSKLLDLVHQLLVLQACMPNQKGF